MTIQATFRAALRDVVGPRARAHGFKGSAPTWRRTNDLGDCAIVNVQGSSSSSASSGRFVINISVVPAPWAAWMEENLGRRPKALPESWGLYRDRLHPSGPSSGPERWWRVDRPWIAEDVAADMVRQLDAHGWPVLERLLDWEAMVEHARAGGMGTREGVGRGVCDRSTGLIAAAGHCRWRSLEFAA